MNSTKQHPFRYAGPVVLTIADATVTLIGQPKSYWDDYATVAELAPAFAYLLKVHPMMFVLGVLVWIVIYLALIRYSRAYISIIISISFIIGHFLGALTWLLYRFRMDYHMLFILIPLLSALVYQVTRENLAQQDAS